MQTLCQDPALSVEKDSEKEKEKVAMQLVGSYLTEEHQQVLIACFSHIDLAATAPTASGSNFFSHEQGGLPTKGSGNNKGKTTTANGTPKKATTPTKSKITSKDTKGVGKITAFFSKK